MFVFSAVYLLVSMDKNSITLVLLIDLSCTLLNMRIIAPCFALYSNIIRKPLCSSGQSSWLQIQMSRVRFPALEK
jgi:hypothetical protein